LKEELFKEVMVKFSKLYGKEIDSDLVQIYWKSIQHIPDDSFAGACNHIIGSFKPTSTCPFPVPAHFIEHFTRPF